MTPRRKIANLSTSARKRAKTSTKKSAKNSWLVLHSKEKNVKLSNKPCVREIG